MAKVMKNLWISVPNLSDKPHLDKFDQPHCNVTGMVVNRGKLSRNGLNSTDESFEFIQYVYMIYIYIHIYICIYIYIYICIHLYPYACRYVISAGPKGWILVSQVPAFPSEIDRQQIKVIRKSWGHRQPKILLKNNAIDHPLGFCSKDCSCFSDILLFRAQVCNSGDVCATRLG